MKTINIELTDAMRTQLQQIVAVQRVSINQFVTIAIAEKMAALETVDYVEKRAERGSREKLLAALAQAPDVEPEDYDKL